MGATPGMLPSYLCNSMCCALLLQSNRSALVLFYFSTFLFFSKNFWFWLGGAAPQTPRFLAGGAKPLASHLIEAAKRGRLDQMIFVSAPLTTQVAPTTVRKRRLEKVLGLRTFGHYKKVPGLRTFTDKVPIHGKKKNLKGETIN